MDKVKAAASQAMYSISDATTALTGGKQILFVLSSHGTFKDGKPTGWYLPEAAHPYYTLKEAGYSIDFASPKGGKAPLDPSSIENFKTDAQCTKFLADEEAKLGYENTKTLFEVQHTAYDSIFFVGGHGPCFDLCEDLNSIELIEKFYAAEKPVAAVCHAPVVLVKAKDTKTGESIVKGRKVTCFTDAEEEQAGLTHAIPFLVETRLRELGSKFENTEPWGAHVVKDGLLLTGQNPASAGPLAELLIKTLEA